MNRIDSSDSCSNGGRECSSAIGADGVGIYQDRGVRCSQFRKEDRHRQAEANSAERKPDPGEARLQTGQNTGDTWVAASEIAKLPQHLACAAGPDAAHTSVPAARTSDIDQARVTEPGLNFFRRMDSVVAR